MKVGIYYPGYKPESGGGYTFENEVLTSLIQLAGESSHQFILLHDITPNRPHLSPIKEISIEKSKPKKVIRLVINKLLDLLNYQNKKKVYYSLSEACSNEHLEFVWFLTPIYGRVNLPYIATIWDIQHRLQPWFPEVGSLKEWQGREKYNSWFIQRAAFIIVPNKTSQEEITFFYRIPTDRFLLLPHPTPKICLQTPQQVNEVLQKYGLLKNRFLLYPAQFWPHKNHVNLLKALVILREKNYLSIPLVLVGSDKGNLAYIKKCVDELGLEQFVRILGFIPRDDLIGLYQSSFALTFLSLFGPENIPPLEAFQCECPVIASNVAGSKEQLGDAALLVDGTKPDEIAQAIIRLIDSPDLRHELIVKGKERASSFTGFDYVRNVFSTLDQFEKIRGDWPAL